MKNRVNIVCFCALLTIFCALIVIAPADKKIETLENRTANKAPALNLQTAFNGDFSRNFNDFIADQVGFRTDLILLSKSISGNYGISLKDEPVIVISNNPRGGVQDETVDPFYQSDLDDRQQDNQLPGSGGTGGSANGASVSGAGAASADNGAPGSDDGISGTGGGAVTGDSSGNGGNSANVGGGSGLVDAPNPGQTQTDLEAADNGPTMTAQKNNEPERQEIYEDPSKPGNVNQPKPDRSSVTEEAPPGSVEPVRVGPLLAFPDRLMEIFGYSESACKQYAAMVNAYANALDGKARVFSLVTPTAIEFVDEKYKSLSDSEYTAIQTVYSNLNSDNAYAVDAYSRLSAHRDEYIFFRTDHHWTALGAYYAYLAYCEAADLTPVRMVEYDSYEAPGFLGYLYSFNPTKELKDNPDTIIYYTLKEPLEVSNPLLYTSSKATYSIFIGGDHPIYRITTSVKNGRTCVILKDSFGNAFVPWIAPNYENIIVIDPRHFEGSVTSTISGYEDVDLIILNYAFAAGSGGMTGPLNRIR